MSPVPPSDTPIPASLRGQLDDFRRRLWRGKIQETVLACLIGLCASFLIVFTLDRFWQTPGPLRLAILLAGTSLSTVFAPWWLHRWVWRHRRESQLARLIAKRFPGLGDRLLGVIELQDQHEAEDSMSPRLRAAAMEAVAEEAAKRKLDDAMPPSRHHRWAWVLAIMGLAILVAAVWTPRAAVNALSRWVKPWGDTPRYTFTQLEPLPETLAVPFGESFELIAKLTPTSEQEPVSGSARLGHQPEVTSERRDREFRFTFPGQQERGILRMRIGDARIAIMVQPVQRPVSQEVNVLITPPAYLQLPAKNLTVRGGSFSAVEASKVEVSFAMSRPLRSASFGPLEGESQSTPLHIEGTLARTPTLNVTDRAVTVPFHWVDEFGLESRDAFRLRIDGMKDSAPSVYLQGIERQKVLLPEETLDFEALVEDDFGVKAFGLEWQGTFTKPTDAAPAQGEMKLGEGKADAARLLAPVAFSPAALGIAPQRLVVRAFAEDFLPGRGRVYSEPVVLHVLTRDEHAQLLKAQFDRAITELEDAVRRERNLLEENERLRMLDGNQLQSDDQREKLKEQQQAEAANRQRIDELQKKIEQLFKDATRNESIDKNVLGDLALTNQLLRELAQQDMPKIESSLGNAQESTNTPEQTKRDLSEAVKEQQKAVEKMQAAADRANEADRKFEAGTFVNRLKKAAAEEAGIANSLIEGFNRMLGIAQIHLDPSDARRLKESSRQQAETASDVRWIEEDLGHYFARTNKEPFKKILDEMQTAKIGIALDDIRQRLGNNHSGNAVESAMHWSERLNAWAKSLEEAGAGGGGGGGAGSGQANPEDEDFEFMLRVMKMVQQETDLRARTRALEQFRRAQNPSDTQPESP